MRGQGTLIKGRQGPGWSNVEVPVRTLSAMADELELSRVRLMKIDVEGYEHEVLQGAREWFHSTSPDAIVFESNETGKEGEPDPVLAFLVDHGYSLYAIPRQLVLLKLAPYRGDGRRVATSHDMLAVRKDRERELVSRFAIAKADHSAGLGKRNPFVVVRTRTPSFLPQARRPQHAQLMNVCWEREAAGTVGPKVRRERGALQVRVAPPAWRCRTPDRIQMKVRNEVSKDGRELAHALRPCHWTLRIPLQVCDVRQPNAR